MNLGTNHSSTIPAGRKPSRSKVKVTNALALGQLDGCRPLQVDGSSLSSTSDSSSTDPSATTTKSPPDLVGEIARGYDQSYIDAWLLDCYQRIAAVVQPGDVLVDSLAMQISSSLSKSGYAPPRLMEICDLIQEHQQAEQQARKDEARAAAIVATGNAASTGPVFYAIDSNSIDEHGKPYPKSQHGMYVEGGRRLTNVVIRITSSTEVLDDYEVSKRFEGTLLFNGREHEFKLDSKQYASNECLKAAIIHIAGPEVQLSPKMDEIRNAIAALSDCSSENRVTTNFGWTEDGESYLIPGGRITKKRN